MVLLTLGPGTGGGIVINGKIYGGFNYCGAEIGPMAIKKEAGLSTVGNVAALT